MKNSLLKTLGIMSVVFALSACSSTTSGVAQELRSPADADHSYNYNDTISEDYLAFKNKMRVFSSKISESFIYRDFDPEKNIAISPISLELCLGLAVSASSSETRNEILNAFDMDLDTFNKFYKLYYDELSFEVLNEYNEPESLLSFTNSIWADNELALKEQGLNSLVDERYCYAYSVDFNNDNRKSNHAINRFVRDHTNEFLSPQFEFSKETVLALINTIYLKDVWNLDGDDLSYADEKYKFTNLNGEVSKERLLEGHYFPGKVIEAANYSSFYTQTKAGLKLYFVKPHNVNYISDISPRAIINNTLDDNSLVIKDDVKKEKYQTKCIFPEFYVHSDNNLRSMLIEDLLIGKLFTSECNFSNLTDENICCETIKQYIKLNVEKSGIEGGAATYIAMEATAEIEEYEIVHDTFVVDREFGFVITNKTNDILFSGIVTNID